MPKLVLPSFSKGELAPALQGRVDTAAYQVGLARARNVIAKVYGGIKGRGGTKFVAPVKDHSVTPRMVPFQFKTTDTHTLELGDRYARVMRGDGHILETITGTPTAITNGATGVVTIVGHEFLDGMEVTFEGIGGMTELNGNTYTIGSVTADTFALVGIDTTAFGTFTSGGTATQDLTITNATQANPVVLTVAGHNFTTGDEVFISGVQGMTRLNGNRYLVGTTTSSTFQLKDQADNTDIDGTSFPAYTSGGTVGRVYELTSPFTLASLFELTFVQSADVMTLAHRDIGAYELRRLDLDRWEFTEVTAAPTIDDPNGITVTVDTSGAETDRYTVTAIDPDTLEESLAGLNNSSATITGATQANPVVVTATAHGHLDGDEVEINGIVGMTELNNNRYIVANSTANTYELTSRSGDNIDGTAFTAYTSGGQSTETFVRVTTSAVARDNTIAWSRVSQAIRYVVYKEKNGLFGFIGETEALTFKDDNIDPDVTLTPPTFRNPFDGDNNKPGTTGYFEQRRVFGGSANKPDTSEYSQTGNQSNFNKSTPSQDDDAISATLASQRVNEIRHYVSLNDLLVFTSGSEWRVNSGPDQAFGPATIKQKPQSSWGCSFLPPIVFNNTVLFVPASGASVRSFGYSLQLDGYTGSDLTLLSGHFFEGYSLLDWSFITSPDNRILIPRSDGQCLSLTFEQEQEVVAWTSWDTDGKFLATSSLPGGGQFAEDTTYFVVRRIINGKVRRYIEVWRETFFDDVQDYYGVDCGLTIDSPLLVENIEADGAIGGVARITITAHGLSDGDEIDVSDIIWQKMFDENFNETFPTFLNGGPYLVRSVTPNTFILEDDGGDFVLFPTTTSYVEGGKVRQRFFTFSGLDHLEGKQVVALANGNVVGTDTDDTMTVANGSITLVESASRVHIGLQYISDIELLDVEIAQGTLQGRRISIPSVTVRFNKSRGMLFGPDKDNLREWSQREKELLGEPTRLLTGVRELTLEPMWKSSGRVFFRQKDPLPLEILSVVPTFVSEDDE